MVFQIKAKTETHCASYIVDVTADRSEDFSVYSENEGVKLSL